MLVTNPTVRTHACTPELVLLNDKIFRTLEEHALDLRSLVKGLSFDCIRERIPNSRESM